MNTFGMATESQDCLYSHWHSSGWSSTHLRTYSGGRGAVREELNEGKVLHPFSQLEREAETGFQLRKLG